MRAVSSVVIGYKSSWLPLPIIWIRLIAGIPGLDKSRCSIHEVGPELKDVFCVLPLVTV